MGMKLVSDAKDFLKWFETWAAMLGLALSFGWHALPPEFQQLILNKYGMYAAGALFILSMVGSLVAQPKLPGSLEPPKDTP
jgi:hypothetical protein